MLLAEEGNGTLAVQRPVGTRGGVGWMWGPCACPRPVHVIRRDIIIPRENLSAMRTSTRPPPLPASAPCPYWTGLRHYSVRSANSIRTEGGYLSLCFHRGL